MSGIMKSISLGIIQGLTEFLPVSSSGHLYFFKIKAHIEQSLLSFFVFLHFATLLAVLWFFRKEIRNLFHNRKLLFHTGIITVVTGILALIIKHFFEPYFENKYTIAVCFFLNTLILFSIRNRRGDRGNDTITVWDSCITGIVQGFSVFPGISRSGSTISALLHRGFKKEEAFTFSFVAAIPILVAAFVFEVKDIILSDMSFFPMAAGFVSAFISGLLAIKIARHLVIKMQFSNFGYYTLLMAFLSLFLY